MRLADAIGLRIGGKDAIEARLNGQVVWSPPVSDQLQSVLDLLYPAGEEGVFRLYQQTALGQQLLYRDSSATTATTNASDPIGYARDLSGNDNHGIQTVSSARPTAFPGIFDGVDDHLVSAGGFGAGDFAMCFAIDAARLTNDSVIASNYDGSSSGFILYGSTPLGSANGNIRLWTGVDLELIVGPDLRGSGKKVISVSRLGSTYTLRIDGVQIGQAAGSTASLLRPTLFLGRRGGTSPNCISADFIADAFFDNATLEKVETVESYFATLL